MFRDIDQKLGESCAVHVGSINDAAENGVKAVSGVISGAAGVFEDRVNKRLGALSAGPNACTRDVSIIA